MINTKFSIPKISDGTLDLEISTGQTLFILGANGSGKSALIQRIYNQQESNAIRIAAHRTNFFEAETPDLSPLNRDRYVTEYRRVDTFPDARWKHQHGEMRNQASLYDLIESINKRAKEIANFVDCGAFEKAVERSKEPSSINVINQLLTLSNISAQLTIDGHSQLMVKQPNGQSYSVARLSDGERNSLLLICDILNAKSDSLIIIDEPERHLHHSIINPLLTMLFNRRKDLVYVIATHDVSLPLVTSNAKTLLIRGCQFDDNGVVVAWDCDIVTDEVPEDVKADVLGARRKILFVEGNSSSSLDKPLYAAIFPQISVIAKNSCSDVEHCVKGVRQSNNVNWLQAWGIVDGDYLDEKIKLRLKNSGIFSLPFHSIESLYYHPKIQNHLVKLKTNVQEEIDKMLTIAAERTIQRFSNNLERMAQRSIEVKIRELIKLETPGQTKIKELKPIQLYINVKELHEQECAKLNSLINENNIHELITKFPVRETGALIEIAKSLGYKDRDEYETSVQEALLKDTSTLDSMKELLGIAFWEISQEAANYGKIIEPV